MMPVKREEDLSAPGVPTRRALVVRPSSRVALAGAILFVHGFAISPESYSALGETLASQGFAVVLPNVYKLTDAVGSEVPSVLAWSARVASTFPSIPFIVASHSRGGQASLLALFAGASVNFPIPPVRAVILFDPVEGSPSVCCPGKQKPYLLANDLENWTLDVSLPVLIFGAQLGTQGLVPAAPEGHNYDAIWDGFMTYVRRQPSNPSRPLRMFQIVHPQFGHIDYLNNPEDCKGLVTNLAQYVTRCGRAGRAALRHFVSQAALLFLQAYATERGDARPWQEFLHNVNEDAIVRIRYLESVPAPIL